MGIKYVKKAKLIRGIAVMLNKLGDFFLFFILPGILCYGIYLETESVTYSILLYYLTILISSIFNNVVKISNKILGK